MRVVTRKALAEMPGKVLYAEVGEDGRILDGFLIKGKMIGENNWFVTDIDTDSIDPKYPIGDDPKLYDEAMASLISGKEEYPLSLGVSSDEGTGADDDRLYIVYDGSDIRNLIEKLGEVLISTAGREAVPVIQDDGGARSSVCSFAGKLFVMEPVTAIPE